MEYKDIEKANAEIKTLALGKKQYAEVAERVRAFRKLYPEGRIITALERYEGGEVIMRAHIMTEDGETLATGFAKEKEGSTNINRTSALENCETSAVGRALGFLGLTGGASIASFEEVSNAKLQQEGALLASTKEKQGLIKSAEAKGLAIDDVLAAAGFNRDEQPEGLTREQYARAMDYIIKSSAAIV
jgi:hypothetical protein